jgi:tetratricopeptide (TPR) repeat protein
MQRGDLDDAVALFREAIALKPDYAEAYCNLGAALQRQGRLAESLASYRRGHELGSRRPGWPYPSAEWLREAEQLVALEGRFAEFQDGKFQPKDNAERLGLAKIGLLKQAFPTAARLFAEAGDRYDAACCAARAGTGQGPEAARLDAAGRARLRNQACAWLRAELGDWTKRLDSARPADRLAVQQQLQRWQRNSDLAGVRDRDALAKLPADEREAWRKLWGDVEVLRQQATRR